MLTNFPQPYYKDEYCMLYKGNALEVLRQFPNDSISCVVTSPPFYKLRSYGEETVVTWGGDENCEHIWENKTFTLRHKSGETSPGKEAWYKDKGASDDEGNQFCSLCRAWRGQLGNEPSVSLFLAHILSIFAEVKRVLRPDGTVWVELGDSYDVEKSLLCVPFRFATGMTEMGYLLRNTIVIWKRSCVPCSAMDRLTVDHSYLFFFTKSRDYWFQQQFEPSVDSRSYTGRFDKHGYKQYKVHSGIGKGGIVGKTYPLRNKRTVWDVTQQGLREDHYAPFSTTLVETPISAGCPEFVCRVCNRPRKLVVKKEYIVRCDKNSEKYKKLINLTWGPIMAGFNVSDVYYDDCDCIAEDKWRPGIVLDPFAGTSTTGVVAIRQRKFYVGIDLSSKYLSISLKRIAQVNLSQKTQDAIQENKPLQRMLF